MATKNTRIVGYLPPPYHEKLREYMKEQSITESAALVKIVKQFFDGSTELSVQEVTKEKDDAIARILADIVELKRRMMVLEQAVVSGKQRSFTNSKASQKPLGPLPMLPPQSCADARQKAWC